MIFVEYFTKDDWSQYSENAHKIAFKEKKDPSLDRIDYALMAVEGTNPMGYITCRELDGDTVYWQFGGTFPGTRGTLGSWQVVEAFISFCKQRYKRITVAIENTNFVMLRMAMKAGFMINGIRYYAGTLLVEHVLEFG